MDSGSQKQTTEPWKEQKPFLTQGFQAAEQLFQGNQPAPYPEQSFAGLTQPQLESLNQMYQRSGGSPYEQIGLNQLGGTAAGQYLGGNPATSLAYPTASGQNIGMDPRLMYGMNQATGGEIGANPLYQMGAGTAAGQNLYNDPRFGTISSLAYGQGVGTNPAYGYLGDVASGGQMGPTANDDAYLRMGLDRIGSQYSETIDPTRKAGFTNARGGSEWGASGAELQMQGRQEENLGDRMSDFTTNYLANIRNSDAARQVQASGILGGTYSGEIGQQMGAANQLGQGYQFGAGQQQAMQGALGGTFTNEQQMRDSMLGQTGGAFQTGVGQQLSGINSISSPYEQERVRMVQAGGQVPGISQATDYGNIGQMYQAGQPLQQLEQQSINQAMSDWAFQQQVPYDQLQNYMAMIQGSYGGTSQGSQQLGAGNIAGGLLSTAGMLGGAWLGGLG